MVVMVGKKEWGHLIKRIEQLETDNKVLRQDIEIYNRDKKNEVRVNQVSSWLGRGDGSVKRATSK